MSSLVGARVSVQWNPSESHEGVATAARPETGQLFVEYDDGEECWEDAAKVTAVQSATCSESEGDDPLTQLSDTDDSDGDADYAPQQRGTKRQRLLRHRRRQQPAAAPGGRPHVGARQILSSSSSDSGSDEEGHAAPPGEGMDTAGAAPPAREPQHEPRRQLVVRAQAAPSPAAAAAEERPVGSSLSVASVTIAGFKSFREQTTVGPFSHFTCIVGPNGAGKSSVLDAIVFVLGSKTSDLRGSTLSDLVNEAVMEQGRRDPGAAPAEAAVTLNLVAQDRKMAVTRRVVVSDPSNTSSARSEYLVDSRKSSRSEIGKLLLEFGIDVDMPSRFVMLQSRTVGIIRQGPGKLLDYLEEIIGTIGLRRQIEDLRQQESEHRCATAKVSVPSPF